MRLFVLSAFILLSFFLPFPFTALRAEDALPEQKTAPAMAAVTDEAQRIYQNHGDAVYQVQVIDLASGKKNSIGSGFQFNAEGMIATNYHVVAEALQRPDSNRLEYLHDRGGGGALKILMVDVVRDLAVVQMDKPGKTFVALGSSGLPKGTRLFALGNPHDIGFTIIEGTYNGLSQDSFIDKIHFSGALNPGMSGGPALNHDGQVVGINVSTAGNQISFLVPVEPLRQLLADYAARPAGFDFPADANRHIQEQLLAYQEKIFGVLLDGKPWESVPFGPVMAPGRIHNVFRCWGGQAHQEKDPFRHFGSTCSSQDELFLDSYLDTGVYLYRYDQIVGKERLPLARFYSLYESRYSQPLDMDREVQEDDLTNFECNDGFVDAAGLRWKTSFCVRQYKKYPSLWDMHLYMALVGEGRQGLMVSVAAEGVSRKNALGVARRFMREIRPAEARQTGEGG